MINKRATTYQANQGRVQNPTNVDHSKLFQWNNKAICVSDKFVYHNKLANKGILRMEDLLSEDSTLIINHHSTTIKSNSPGK